MVGNNLKNGQGSDKSAAMSYKLLRNIVGLLGMSLPIIVIVGAYFLSGLGPLDSISAYYHSVMRDFFVGVLFITGALLITYNPEDYPDGYIDNIASIAAGIFAIGIAIFPADLKKTICTKSACTPEEICITFEILGVSIKASTLHTASAVGFLVILALFSLLLFTKSGGRDDVEWTPKKIRYYIYIVCGSVMAAALVLMLIYFFLRCKFPELQPLNLIFWLEFVALLFFGFSWLTKGQFFFADKK